MRTIQSLGFMWVLLARNVLECAEHPEAAVWLGRAEVRRREGVCAAHSREHKVAVTHPDLIPESHYRPVVMIT